MQCDGTSEYDAAMTDPRATALSTSLKAFLCTPYNYEIRTDGSFIYCALALF